MNILICNGIILPMNAGNGERPYYNGYLGIEGERIAFVSADSRQAEDFAERHSGDCRRIDATGKVVMPGFISDLTAFISSDTAVLQHSKAELKRVKTCLNHNLFTTLRHKEKHLR